MPKITQAAREVQKTADILELHIVLKPGMTVYSFEDDVKEKLPGMQRQLLESVSRTETGLRVFVPNWLMDEIGELGSVEQVRTTITDLGATPEPHKSNAWEVRRMAVTSMTLGKVVLD